MKEEKCSTGTRAEKMRGEDAYKLTLEGVEKPVEGGKILRTKKLVRVDNNVLNIWNKSNLRRNRNAYRYGD